MWLSYVCSDMAPARTLTRPRAPLCVRVDMTMSLSEPMCGGVVLCRHARVFRFCARICNGLAQKKEIDSTAQHSTAQHSTARPGAAGQTQQSDVRLALVQDGSLEVLEADLCAEKQEN